MIDAYEIGIRLALQDDVSAGLAVISRELAEVDRGIAATSAALSQLTRLTGVTGKAVSTGDARREKQDPGAVPSTGAPEQGARETPVASERLPDPVAPRATATATASDPTPVINGPGAADAPSAPAVRPEPRQVASERVVTSVPAATQAIGGAAATATDGTAPSAPMVVASAPQAPATLQERGAATRMDSGSIRPPSVSSSPSETVRSPAAPARARGMLQVMSSIVQRSARDTAGEGSRGAVAADDPAPMVPFVMPSLVPLAPPSETRSQNSSSQIVRPMDRAAAPQASARDQADSGGGTIMLDGRLVGYWLSEQMARDASRPSSSTTHFDPRQGPSWTASGTV